MYNNPKVTDKDGNVIDPHKEALEKYARNITQLARDGKLEPVFGRTQEINSCFQILARRTKSNCILLGLAGIGKTSIVEAMSMRIVNKDVPNQFLDKEVYELSLTQLTAGAKYVGDFEERLKSVVEAVRASKGKIILFCDEAHLLLGAGATGEGSLDAANILKPALARGEIKMIAATTLEEYRKYFEKDAALVRRFSPVYCEPPTTEQTINILRGLKQKFEAFHGIEIRDSALVAAVHLSNRYIPSRNQPDKSIDLIDASASAIRVQLDSKPAVIDNIERSLLQKRVEQTALKNEMNRLKQAHENLTKALGANLNTPNPADPAIAQQQNRLQAVTQNLDKTTKRLKAVQDDVNNLQVQLAPLQEQYEKQYGKNKELQLVKQKLNDIKAKIETAERAKDFAKIADLKFGALVDIEAKIKRLEAEIAEERKEQNRKGNCLISEILGPEQIAEVCSHFTGIPLSKLSQSESNRYLHLEQELHEKVVGQPVAVKAVANAIIRNKSGFSKPNQPIASFLFCGSSGTGKTELCKQLAASLFDDEKALIRFDMSEFSEKHSVSKFVGASAGYIGYENAGLLTEAVRNKPYAVLLFDEAEKAHPSVFNVLLSVLDDGRLTDNKGRVVDFSNTVIIFTSNLGAQYLQPQKKLNYDPINNPQHFKQAKPHVLEAIKKFFAPEFLNRLTELVLFEPLTAKHMFGIIKLQLAELSSRMVEHDLKLDFLNEAEMEKFVNATHDSQYGARGVKRVLERSIVTHLAKEILRGRLPPHTLVQCAMNPAYNTNNKSNIVSGRSNVQSNLPVNAAGKIVINGEEFDSSCDLLLLKYVPFASAGIGFGDVQQKGLGDYVKEGARSNFDMEEEEEDDDDMSDN